MKQEMKTFVDNAMITYVVSTIFITGCFDDFQANGHGCENCLECEECIPDENGAYCQADSHAYAQCSATGDVHWYDACDVEEEVALLCLNGECIDSTTDDSYCECSNAWEGPSCDYCPGNWDSEQDCAVCQNAWVDENNDCGTCPPNWNENTNCSVCLGNWDIEQDCQTCLNQWIDEGNNCET